MGARPSTTESDRLYVNKHSIIVIFIFILIAFILEIAGVLVDYEKNGINECDNVDESRKKFCVSGYITDIIVILILLFLMIYSMVCMGNPDPNKLNAKYINLILIPVILIMCISCYSPFASILMNADGIGIFSFNSWVIFVLFLLVSVYCGLNDAIKLEDAKNVPE